MLGGNVERLRIADRRVVVAIKAIGFATFLQLRQRLVHQLGRLLLIFHQLVAGGKKYGDGVFLPVCCGRDRILLVQRLAQRRKIG